MAPPEPKSSPAPSGQATQRIAKLLARAGIASRREIERMIAEGRVAIDGKAIDTPATLLTSLRGVTVDGKPVQAAAPARLFLYHKPTGLLVTERDPKGRPTIYDKLPRGLPRLVPVGRLDLNTEGLLLLTTDGELKRLLELPATGVERSYRARTFGNVSQEQLEALIEGVEIEGIRYGAIDANLERRTGANAWIELTLKEGKNREVRRVLEHLGLQVSRLIRTRYGPFVLADLPPGAIGEVRQADVINFRKAPTRADRLLGVEPIGAEKPRPAPAPAPTGRPARPAGPGKARPPRAGVAKPARAARAKAFRERQGEEAAPAQPKRPARPAGKPAPRARSAEDTPRTDAPRPRKPAGPRSGPRPGSRPPRKGPRS
ncbi:pseudouridine synthase [Sphingomonas sp.]|uniref:pseudouridine synthase n=1 Tax=Sphingomonas sp. TaxID=28214 RepID=UPI001B046C54|nr:pseudouridine synthase [Sphingomonas sp.]MBO9711854.1 pseudouridine synthase [Sphingomonas sp.]